MKTSRPQTRILITLIALAACLAALPAPAQDIDLELAAVNLEVGNNEYRLQPQIRLHNAGNLASHMLKVAFYYGPILRQEIGSMVDYIQNNHTCWNYSWPNCGSGDCLDIYTLSAFYEGTCANTGFFYHCACSYEVETYFAWEPYTGEPMVTVVVDPFNEVAEADETNNVMTISLEPVEADGPTFSDLKTLYR